MKKPKRLIRYMFVYNNTFEQVVVFARRLSGTQKTHLLRIGTNRISERSLNRLDNLTNQATKTTVMFFRDTVCATSTFPDRIISCPEN